MNPIEKRAVTTLAGVFGLRMFGLFLILPVFALYAERLEGTTPFWLGLTLGAYGLTQAILQIPFGILSDRWGRKQTIVAGLILFLIGSVVAAMADSIQGVFVGRLIQGAGAISSAAIALMADLTREDQRTKAMAVIGIGIGVIFMLSMILGPLLDTWIGVSGIFWMTALFALLAMWVVLKWTPNPVQSSFHREAEPVLGQVGEVLRNVQLLRLNLGIFTLHLTLTALFVVVPFLLIEHGMVKTEHWKVYIPVMLLGVIGMLPFMAFSHRREYVTRVFELAIALLALSMVVLMLSTRTNWTVFFVGFVLFFAGFNTLEANLPSVVSRVAPAASKGTAMGLYNSAQFFGVFVGGTVAGYISGSAGANGVFLFCFAIVMIWLGVMLVSSPFKLGESRLFHIEGISDRDLPGIVKQLREVKGVEDITAVFGEPTAYLKIDPEQIDEKALAQLISATDESIPASN